MSTHDSLAGLDPELRAHLGNIADNLQLVADLGYGDVALALAGDGGRLTVIADARPNTAIAPIPATRAGATLSRDEEPEAYLALDSGEPVFGDRRRVARGIKYSTAAYPVGSPARAVVVRDLAEQVAADPGRMESAFMEAAEELLDAFGTGPLLDARTGEPFATTRRAGDGVMRVGASGQITYASPNAVNIMRLAGVEGGLVGSSADVLPGAALAVTPILGSEGAIAADIEVADRAFRYRSISLPAGALVLVEDVTESLQRETEIKVKEATIREVHHRVKNNLQTIASLLRIQARRSDSDEARRALAEATERVSSMAVVHDLLAGSDAERVDFAEATRTVVEMVRRGMVGEAPGISVTVSGETGEVDAHTATSLALAVAELVHNALEHGVAGNESGAVVVTMRRVPGELVLSVRDNGAGLPPGFDPDSSANLGLAIVRTVVQDDLRGTLTFSGGARGTIVTVRVPLADAVDTQPAGE